MAKEETKDNEKNKILFFDDDPFTVNSLALNLRLLGWDVKFVPEIDELFHELNQNHYNILILDIMAPEPIMKGKYVNFEQSEIDDMADGMMTGVVLAKKIWRIEKYKNIPVLFHSARSNPIPSDEVLQNSKCDFMRKPERAIIIDKKLREWI